MITSPDNQQLKTIRKLHERRRREQARPVHGRGRGPRGRRGGRWEPEYVLRAGVDVEPRAARRGEHARLGHARDRRLPRSAGRSPAAPVGATCTGRGPGQRRHDHPLRARAVPTARCVGPGCADPYSPKAVRASMGSIFARPPARARAGDPGRARRRARPRRPLDARATLELGHGPVVLCLGAEREGLPEELLERAAERRGSRCARTAPTR